AGPRDGLGSLPRALRAPHRGGAALLGAGARRKPRVAAASGVGRGHEVLLPVVASGRGVAGDGAGGPEDQEPRAGWGAARGAGGVATEAPRRLGEGGRLPAAAQRRRPRPAPARPRRDALPHPLWLPPRGRALRAGPRR